MSQSFHFRITEEEAGQRLDEFLASRFGSLSRMRLANLVSAGACKINESLAQRGWRIAAGDLVEIAIEEGAPTAMEPDPIPLEILYEDDHIIVVVKPSGLLVHPSKNVKRGTLANALAYHFNREIYDLAMQTPAHGHRHSLLRPGLAHRLDRATSGLMVVAKTTRSLSRLSRHFHRRLVEKRYLALVRGRIDEDAGEIEAPIGRDVEQQPQWGVMESGRPALTRFNAHERFDQATLLELEPVTGRTNQLRIHCAHFGHPILGDEMYGIVDGGQSPVVSKESGNKALCNDRWPLATGRDPARLCLHAWRLAFHHPVSGQRMEFVSPLPEEIAQLINDMRKSS